MTRMRVFGEDKPFLDWVRNRKDIPSSSAICGVGVADVDAFFHRYLMAVDEIGTREVQALMHVEVKTRNGRPTGSQVDTFWKLHAFRGAQIIGGRYVRNFGSSFLVLSGETPDDSDSIQWGRFVGSTREIRYIPIDIKQLIALLRFDIHPDNLQTRPFRRHHKRHEIVTKVREPLGFESVATVTRYV